MSPEFVALITVLVVQLAGMYQAYQARKSGAPLSNAQAESAMGDALDKLGQAYDRSLDTIKVQNEELVILRPLTLKVILQEQEKEQTQKDKEDWKRYSERLVEQIEAKEMLPIPFRRYPGNGDSQRMKSITKKQELEKKE